MIIHDGYTQDVEFNNDRPKSIDLQSKPEKIYSKSRR